MTSTRSTSVIAVAIGILGSSMVVWSPSVDREQPGFDETLAATAPEQAPTQGVLGETRPELAPRNKFLEGWMEELLYGDRAMAQTSYREAMAAKGLPGFQSELATSRLWESSWSSAERRGFREALSRMERSTMTQTGVFGRTLGRLDDLRKKFEMAMQDGGLELDALRTELQGVLRTSTLRDPRQLIKTIIPELRGEHSTSDPELERLKAEHKRARERGDAEETSRAWRKIQDRYQMRRYQASDRIHASRWAYMTRLHFAGEHRKADGMEKQLRLRNRFNRRGSRRRTADEILRVVGKWDPAVQETKLGLVLSNLQRLRRPRRFAALSAEDQKVLIELEKELTDLRAEGKTEEALRLAARVPYRNPLFWERTGGDQNRGSGRR